MNEISCDCPKKNLCMLNRTEECWTAFCNLCMKLNSSNDKGENWFSTSTPLKDSSVSSFFLGKEMRTDGKVLGKVEAVITYNNHPEPGNLITLFVRTSPVTGVYIEHKL